jgi:formylglycine-generating enzyme required for sulfatase activity
MKFAIFWILVVMYSMSALAKSESWLEPQTGMPFVFIDEACFGMGSEFPVAVTARKFWRLVQYEETMSADEVPYHQVCLDGFWIGQFEVRLSDWNLVMNGTRNDDHTPVANISWEQAKEFISRINEKSKDRFRLPTEAEWEYACDAGMSIESEAVGTELLGKAWYNRGEARRAEPQPVGQLQANVHGLYDMLGNVWEWTEDTYHMDGYAQHDTQNPVLKDPGGQKVIRGGSIRTEPRQTRCTVRGHLGAEQKLQTIGFRLVRIPQ